MNKGQVEAEVKEKFIKVYKSQTGKGPRDITVKVSKNFLIIECKEVLTLLEKTSIKSDKNIDKIRDLRDYLMERVFEEFTAFLGIFLRLKVVDLVDKINFRDDTLYALFVFENNLEKQLEYSEMTEAR